MIPRREEVTNEKYEHCVIAEDANKRGFYFKSLSLITLINHISDLELASDGEIISPSG